MPFLDVSDLTIDPDFADYFIVTRRLQVLDHGRNTFTNIVYDNQIGVIDMAGPNDLKRLPEGQYTGKIISIVTPFRLMASGQIGADQYGPDQINWQGSLFNVIWVDDYSRFGNGQVEALAESCTTQDPPPSSPPP